MVLYQVIIMTINFWFSYGIWNLNNDDLSTNSENRTKMFTILFNVFVYMQLFNFFNARIISPKSFNVFDHFFSNLYFVIIVLGLIVLQYLICSANISSLNIVSLDFNTQCGCMCFGASTIIVSSILKLIPEKLVEKLPFQIDENQKVDENDQIMQAYNKQANAKVTNKI